MIHQAEIWWADLGDPMGSNPGFRRPVVVVQSDAMNHSRIGTVVCVPLTSNLKWADAPGNVRLTGAETGLDRDCVANVSVITAIDKGQLMNRAGNVTRRKLDLILAGIDILLDR